MERPRFEFAPASEMSKRRAEAMELFEAVLEPDERPWLISDEATMHDISLEDDAALIGRCERHYGAPVPPEHLGLPLWQLLDYLGGRRTR